MQVSPNKRVAVVGAGISGLTCAYELQKAGFTVTVFERQTEVGGRMKTRRKGDLGFDMGADIFFHQYKVLQEYLKELGLSDRWRDMPLWKHAVYRGGKLFNLDSSNLLFALRFKGLSLWGRFRLVLFLMLFGYRLRQLNFFHLSDVSDQDHMDAYTFACRWAGKEVTDYLVDGFTSCYQFHGAKDMSKGAMLAFMGMLSEGFSIAHTVGGMSTVPEAIAKKLDVRLSNEVTGLERDGTSFVVSTAAGNEKFDLVVLACTADVTKKLLKTPTDAQKNLLDSVRYAQTITVSFKLPVQLLETFASAGFASVESKKIAYCCHEFRKEDVLKDGFSLVNVGLHDDYAPQIMNKTDDEIFRIVKEAFVEVCEPLQGKADQLQHYDLQRWPTAMPAFYEGYLSKVRQFEEQGQGEGGVYLCGDYLNSPWVEGSMRCGRRVAAQISTSVGGNDLP